MVRTDAFYYVERMATILHLMRRLIGLAALLGSLVSAGGAVAAQGGRWFDKVDALTHFAPIWLLGGVGALVLWLVGGRRGWATPIFVALAVLSSGALMAPELIAAARAERAAPNEETLKIIQFNAYRANYDVERSVAWILNQDADIVVLEEVGCCAGSEVARRIAAKYPFHTRCPGHDCGTAIRSRQAPLRKPYVKLEPGSGTIAWTWFQGVKGPYTVVGVHYTWPSPLSEQWLNRRIMARNIQRFDKDSLIVAGDFNSTPWSFALRRQDRDFGIERRTRALFSWPTKKRGVRLPPFLPLDHLYAGKDWRTVSVERGPALGSDHYPVVITLTR